MTRAHVAPSLAVAKEALLSDRDGLKELPGRRSRQGGAVLRTDARLAEDDERHFFDWYH